MAVKSKHLNRSPWHRFAKISAGLLGGYLISALFHMSLALWLPNPREVLITSIYTHYILWCGLMIVPFLFKSGWKSWGYYSVFIILLYLCYYFGNQNNPFV